MKQLVLIVALVVGCSESDGSDDGNNEACLGYTQTYEACIDAARDAGLDIDVETSDPQGFCMARRLTRLGSV
jgi:hypothetical protein